MHDDIIKGSDAGINHKAENTTIPSEIVEDNIKRPRSMILDFETDTRKTILEDGSVLPHQVMHVEADIIKVSANHIYEDSLIYAFSITGYGCCNDFVNGYLIIIIRILRLWHVMGLLMIIR